LPMRTSAMALVDSGPEHRRVKVKWFGRVWAECSGDRPFFKPQTKNP
jgi:hypothetical protein